MFNRNLLNSLVNWKQQAYPARKPLVLLGARQVGKTSLIKQFGKEHFSSFVYLNLENVDHLRPFQGEISLKDFEQIIDIVFHERLIDGQTLLFIDEIQNSPALLALLRFFYEDRPGLHVIAAGSLLEAKIKREGLSVPVGRVEYRYLSPFDFFEFLEALGEPELLDALKAMTFDTRLPDAIHTHALSLFSEFMAVGGMPEVVATYAQTRSISSLGNLYSSLLTAFHDDVYKYAKEAATASIQRCIETVPLIAGTVTSYEKLGGGLYRGAELSRACAILEQARIIHQIRATESVRLPLIAKERRPKKFLFLDVGLVAYRSGAQGEMLAAHNLLDTFRGRILEQAVGQHLIGMRDDQGPALLYWATARPAGEAEIDFCFANNGMIVGIEVKTGTPSTLRSLKSFAYNAAMSRLVRISHYPLSLGTIQEKEKKYPLVSLPVYLVPRIFDMIKGY